MGSSRHEFVVWVSLKFVSTVLRIYYIEGVLSERLK